MDEPDAELLGHGRTRDSDLGRADGDGSGVGRADAADDAHERGLPGAVPPDQRDDFAGIDSEVDVAQGVDAGKCLRNISEVEEWLLRKHEIPGPSPCT